jgi:hypothetical protein
MATVTAGYNWVSGETVTPAKLNSAAAPTVAVADNEITTAKIADASSTTTGVTNAKLRHSAALSVVGRTANTSGAPADIAAANDGEVLRRSGTAVGFGTVATAGIADAAVTAAKLSGAQTGAAPIFGVRAWAKFAGQSSNGACVVNASGNVTSVTRISSGEYEVVMATALSPDANYAVLATGMSGDARIATFTETTTTFRIEFLNTAGSAVNPAEASFMVIR